MLIFRFGRARRWPFKWRAIYLLSDAVYASCFSTISIDFLMAKVKDVVDNKGDRNIKFFHQAIVIRHQKNLIRSLKNNSRLLVDNDKAIK